MSYRKYDQNRKNASNLIIERARSSLFKIRQIKTQCDQKRIECFTMFDNIA